MASGYPLAVHERTNVEQALPNLDMAFDHPIERAAIKHLVAALRNHAGRVDLFGRHAEGTLVRKSRLDEGAKIIDAVRADAKLEDVESHDPFLWHGEASFNSG